MATYWLPAATAFFARPADPVIQISPAASTVHATKRKPMARPMFTAPPAGAGLRIALARTKHLPCQRCHPRKRTQRPQQHRHNDRPDIHPPNPVMTATDTAAITSKCNKTMIQKNVINPDKKKTTLRFAFSYRISSSAAI